MRFRSTLIALGAAGACALGAPLAAHAADLEIMVPIIAENLDDDVTEIGAQCFVRGAGNTTVGRGVQTFFPRPTGASGAAGGVTVPVTLDAGKTLDDIVQWRCSLLLRAGAITRTAVLHTFATSDAPAWALHYGVESSIFRFGAVDADTFDGAAP